MKSRLLSFRQRAQDPTIHLPSSVLGRRGQNLHAEKLYLKMQAEGARKLSEVLASATRELGRLTPREQAQAALSSREVRARGRFVVTTKAGVVGQIAGQHTVGVGHDREHPSQLEMHQPLSRFRQLLVRRLPNQIVREI